MLVAGTLLALIATGAVLYLTLYGLWNFILAPAFRSPNSSFGSLSFARPDPGIEMVLASMFKYYRHLPPKLKPVFTARVIAFMDSKEFIGKKDLLITSEMKILISASAVQISFGLSKFLLDSFTKIFVYPNEYYSTKDKRYHKGEVNLSGAIALSWGDFKNGFADASDNLNLGLHEMAHALRFDRFRNKDFDVFFAEYFEKFQAVGRDIFEKVKSGEQGFLRSYAGANMEEFFAVCVEYFFESPVKMKQELPDLFRHLCILLNQDPSSGSGSPVQTREKLFNTEVPVTGERVYASSLNYPKPAIPYFLILLMVLLRAWDVVKHPDENPFGLFFWSSALIGLLIYGGFFISKRFTKYSLYTNAFEINYPLNPALKRIVMHYDNLISATLIHSDYTRYWGNIRDTDTLSISYSTGFEIQTEEFSIDGLSTEEIEKLAAVLRSKNVMIKILGTKWSHESIIEAQQFMERE